MRPLIALGDGTLFSFMIVVTNRCNLNCRYCYFKRGVQDQVLSPEEVLNKTRGFKSIVFTGGEPLLNFKWIKEFLTLAKNDKANFDSVILFTNGTLLTDEIASFLKEYNVSVNVSLDGPGFVHDVNRVFPDGSGSFDLVMKGIELLKKHNVDFYVTSVLSHQSYDKVYQTLTFLESLGVKQVGFSSLMTPYKVPMEPLSYKEIITANDQLIKFQEEKKQNNSRILINNLSFIPLPIFIRELSVSNNRILVRPCSAGLTDFVLSADGKIFPCHNSIKYPSLHYFNLSDIPSLVEKQQEIVSRYKKFVSKSIPEKLSFEDVVIGLKCPIEGNFPTSFYSKKYEILRKVFRNEAYKTLDRLRSHGLIKKHFSDFLHRDVKVVDDVLTINGKDYKIVLIE